MNSGVIPNASSFSLIMQLYEGGSQLTDRKTTPNL